LEAEGVEGPGGGFPGLARTAVAEQGVVGGQVFGFDEKLAKGGVGEIGGGGGEDDLGITGQIDFADAGTVVAQGDPAHLDIVLGGHGDVEPGGDAVIVALEDGAFGPEGHAVFVRVGGDGQGGVEGGEGGPAIGR